MLFAFANISPIYPRSSGLGFVQQQGINGTASDPGVLYKPFGPVTQVTFGNGVTQD